MTDDTTPANPSAFPMRDCGPLISKGMTLRDYFAGQALAGLATATDTTGTWQTDQEVIAERAYAYADAMLEQRAKLPA